MSKLCDGVYSLQSRIKRDFSESLLIARNDAREIGLKMADSAAPLQSAFTFPLRAAGCGIFGVREDRKRLKTSVGMGRSSVLSVHSLKIIFPTSRVTALSRRT